MGRWPIVVAFILLVTQIVPAQNRGRSRSPRRLPPYFKALKSHDDVNGIKRAVFKNGSTVVIEEHPSTPLLAVVSHVKLPPGTSRMEAEVISQFAGRQFREAVDALGGYSRVDSSVNESRFASVVPAEKILAALEAHVALYTPRPYDAEELEFLLAGLERKSLNRSQSDSVRKNLFELVYSAPEASEPAIPSADEYLSFMESYYHPRNVIVAVSGSARSEQVLQELVDLYSEVKIPRPKSPLPDSGRKDARAGKFHYRHIRGDVDKPFVVLGYPVPGLGHKDYPAVSLLKYVLAEGQASLLASTHQEEGPNAFLARASVEPAPVGELFLLSLIPEVEEVDQAELRVMALFEALRKSSLPATLLDRAKALMLTDYYEALSQLDRRAYSLAFSEAAGDVGFRNRIPQILLGISAGDLRRVVNSYFSLGKVSIIELFPESAEERTFTEEAFRETLGILVPGEVSNQNSILEVFRTEDEKPGFKLPQFTPSYSERELKRTSILRGPEIYVKEEHSMPLVHLGFFFPGGRINETANNTGITRLTLQAILKNYTRRGGLFALSRLEALGVEMSMVDEADFFGVQALVLSSELNDGVWELLGWLRDPEIEAVDVELARADILRQLSLERTSGRDRLLTSARKQVYGDHPYGFTPEQMSYNVKELTPEQVIEWKDRYLDRVNPHIFALGDVEGTAFLSELVSELSDRKYRVGETTEKDVPVADEATSLLKVVKNEEAGRAILVYPGPEEGSNSAEMLDVALRILGSPNGLLTTTLQKERMLVDELNLFREAGVGGGAVFLEVRAAPENLQESIKEIQKQLGEISETSIPEGLFLDSLVSRLTRHHYRRQVRTAYLQEMVRAVLAGEPADYGARYILNVKQLRIGEIVFAVQRFLGEDN